MLHLDVINRVATLNDHYVYIYICITNYSPQQL